MKEKIYPSDAQERFMVRLPDGMRDMLKAVAAKNNRSMNAEIVARLQESFTRPTNNAEAIREHVAELPYLSVSPEIKELTRKIDEMRDALGIAKILNASTTQQIQKIMKNTNKKE